MIEASEIYRRQAARLLEMASNGAHSSALRASLLAIAGQYETLARHTEQLDDRAWTVAPDDQADLSEH